MNEKYSWAAVLSAIWPGLGQLYQKKKWAPIAMLGYLALGYWMMSLFIKYQAEKVSFNGLGITSISPDATFLIPAVAVVGMWLACVYGPILEGSRAAVVQEPEQPNMERITTFHR